ncbi:Cell-cycle control medial ring component [Penicillium taxi]|uniref:Cell-cycle control medial ring component n=1 Tax=Penicillium taxi TaxID=168475 RepID=UPI0025452A2A|nr:Cell-cycle control medial ring component [Penicillium taxi]KAJ5908710.1 Cell-cycle control medial ring component [Penicillium taxi]
MSEVSFAKSFLSALDSRPIKLRADHVFDPQQVGLHVPYTLPRLQAPHPAMPKKVKKAQAPGSSKSITVHIKSARNPALEFSIIKAPLSTTTIQDLKDAVRERIADSQGNPVALDKIKILYQRKPVGGTAKTIAEILSDEPEMLAGGKGVEFGVMIIGGAQVVEIAEPQPEVPQAADISPPKPAVGPSGAEVLQTEAFWNDLQGYLEQRLKDQEEAERLSILFKGAWSSSQ